MDNSILSEFGFSTPQNNSYNIPIENNITDRKYIYPLFGSPIQVSNSNSPIDVNGSFLSPFRLDNIQILRRNSDDNIVNTKINENNDVKGYLSDNILYDKKYIKNNEDTKVKKQVKNKKVKKQNKKRKLIDFL